MVWGSGSLPGRNSKRKVESLILKAIPEDEDLFVIRGGGYGSGDQNMRAPARDSDHAGYGLSGGGGFRLVLGAAPGG